MGRGLVRVAIVAAVVSGTALTGGIAGAAAMSITVTPHSALHSGAALTVSGSGFAASVPVGVVECEAAPTSPEQCDLDNAVLAHTDGSGTFTAHLAAHRTLFVPTGFVDCAKQACVMLAAGQNFAKHATTPLSFATTGGPAPTLKATPSTKVLDQQQVALAATGFRPSKPVLVAECLSSELGEACVGNQATAAANGKLATSFKVQRILYSTNGTRVDCAKTTTTCEMLVFDPTDADYHATAPLAFDASVPPPPAPTITVTPSTKLPFYAHVTFSGKHWTPNDFPEIGECPTGNEIVCLGNPVGEAIVSGAGTFSATGVVSRYVTDPISGTTIDCAKPANHCVLLAIGGNGSTAHTPLSFNPAAPIPPRPSIALTPAGPYKNNQTVSFTGKNFAPSAEFSVSECIDTKQLGACSGSGGTNWVTDKFGNLHGSTQLARRVSTPDGTVDCLNTKTTTCTLSVDSLGNADATVTLHFVAGSASASAMPSALAWFSGASAASLPRWAAAAEHAASAAANTWHMR
ncbi:MAG TPA: neocarzinostatin apoprotein domain-containing protein [Acidimicrobiia bacterium]|jgi:hypothetical protein